MSKQHFFVRLIPPRPSFATDMTESERALMMQHAAYFAEHFEAGRVLAYGPVMDTTGSFGMGIFEVDDLAEARRMVDADPTIVAGITSYTIFPMIVGGCQSPRS